MKVDGYALTGAGIGTVLIGWAVICIYREGKLQEQFQDTPAVVARDTAMVETDCPNAKVVRRISNEPHAFDIDACGAIVRYMDRASGRGRYRFDRVR